MPSRREYFGGGFAQGLGQALSMLPQMMMQDELMGLKKQMLEAQMAKMKAQEKEDLASQEIAKTFLTRFGGMFGMQAPGSGEEANSGPPLYEPSAPSGSLKQSLMRPGVESIGQAPLAGLQAQMGPSAEAATDLSMSQAPLAEPSMGAVAQGGYVPVPSMGYSQKSGMRFNMQMQPRNLKPFFRTRELPEKPGVVVAQSGFTDPMTGQDTVTKTTPVSSQQFRQNVETAVNVLGLQPGSPEFEETVARLNLGQQLSPEARGELLTGLPGGAGSAVSAAMAGKETRDIRITKAKEEAGARAKQKVQATTVLALVDDLDELLKDIQLPKDAAGRMGESARLLGEYYTQSNSSLVSYQASRKGFLSQIVRFFGERGTLTDKDKADILPLLPVVIPAPGELPDTKTVAEMKMKRLRAKVEEIAQRPPVQSEVGISGRKITPLSGEK